MRRGLGVVQSWPGGELPMVWAVRGRGPCESRPAAITAMAGALWSAFVPVESSAATVSDACVAVQTAAPVEWQQVAARTQGCCEVTAEIG
jgi:hypothetical protein